MKISVIVPAFNCQPYLRRAVESLMATQYENLEIVIVDDGSTDGTLAVARVLQTEHPTSVRVLSHPDGDNRGVSATRNRGIESSTGELIAFLDADDYVHPWRFESPVTILKADSRVSGVHQVSEMVFSDAESAKRWWGGGSTRFGYTDPIPPDETLFTLLRGGCWATSAVLIRRNLLDETGLFLPGLRTCEDCHLWFRMACCGRLVSGDTSRPVSVYYRRLDSAFQPSPRQRIAMVRAMASFYKWMRRRDPNDSRLSRVSSCIAEYILNGITIARVSGDRSLAWQLASHGALWFPPLLQHRRLYAHVSRLTLMR